MTKEQLLELVGSDYDHELACLSGLEPSSLAGWLLMLERELGLAKAKCCFRDGDHGSLWNLRKIVAAGMVALGRLFDTLSKDR